MEGAGWSEVGRGGCPNRARRLTGLRFIQAATEGAKRRRSPGRGAPQGEGPSGRRGRGGAPAGRSGAAPRRAKVQTGGDGAGRGGGRGSLERGASPGGGSSGRRGREGAGRRVHRPGTARAPAGGDLIPYAGFAAGIGRRRGAPCTPREHPDYIYQRVVSPEAPFAPSLITQSDKYSSSRQGKYDISPPRRPRPGSGPPLPGLPGGSNPRTPARSGRIRPSEARSDPGCAPGNHRGALAVRRAPHPAITLRIYPVQGRVAVSRAAGNAAGATRARRPRPPTRLSPPPRGAPHPTDQPARPLALTARLNLRSARRRAQPTSRCPCPPSLPA